jgi:Xaa-Pro aminopeptidase
MVSFAARRDRLIEQLAAAQVDALLISHPINVSYLTGFTGEASHLILGRTKTVLVSDGRFRTQLADECPDLELCIRPPGQTIFEATAQALEALGAASVEFESGHLTVAEAQGLADKAKSVQWKPGANRVEALRQVKDAGEIDQIRAAIRMAEKAFTIFRNLVRPDDTEKDLADNLEHFLRQVGAKSGGFPAIVAVGERAALPHAPPTGKRIVEAPLVLVDWGAAGSFFFRSDLTRVLVHRIHGAIPDGKIRAVYDVVLRAQRAALAALRPGVQGQAVDAAARQVIADAGYGDYFTHGIGHGIGMQIHEAPLMRPGATAELRAGMVVTIEPGIYLPGEFGIRIEDDVLVTPDGAQVLTSVPKDYDACVLEW